MQCQKKSEMMSGVEDVGTHGFPPNQTVSGWEEAYVYTALEIPTTGNERTIGASEPNG